MTTDIALLTKKVSQIREAATRIEAEPKEYDWYNYFQCNCGILVQVVLGATNVYDLITNKTEFRKFKIYFFSGWPHFINGKWVMDRHPIVHEMIAAGYSLEDMHCLEMCVDSIYDNPHDNPVEDHFTLPEHVVSYMRKWADRLESEIVDNVNVLLDEVLV